MGRLDPMILDQGFTKYLLELEFVCQGEKEEARENYHY